MLNRVRAATSRMSQLIDDLLRLSRAGKLDLVPSSVDVSALVHAVVQVLRETQTNPVTIAIQEGMRVEGDPRLLRIVFENLLSNAWKFTARAAEPTIQVGIADLATGRTLFVRDNGVGFDAANARALFEPFQRFHAAHEFAGNGIGLAIAHRIVRRHGGRIWAESAVGGGATFYVAL